MHAGNGYGVLPSDERSGITPAGVRRLTMASTLAGTLLQNERRKLVRDVGGSSGLLRVIDRRDTLR